MAVYNYAEQFSPELQQKYSRELTSFALTQSNPGVKFLNAQTIKLPSITVSGGWIQCRKPDKRVGA